MVFSLVDEEYLDANGNILWDKFTLFGQNKRAWKPFIDFQAPKVQGMRESNSHQRFWRPLSYHLTNPLYLYKKRWLIKSHFHLYLQNHTHYIIFLWTLQVLFSISNNSLRSSFRPISNSQLHTSLCFHPCPIYLIVSKGSLTLSSMDISSWGGLHA